MTPLPDNPVVIIRIVKHSGEILANRTNIGNNLRIVIVEDERTFLEESAGIPYIGKVE